MQLHQLKNEEITENEGHTHTGNSRVDDTNKQKSRCRHHRNRVIKPIDQVKDYTDDEAIELAHKMNCVTLLRTNEGRIYINSHSFFSKSC